MRGQYFTCVGLADGENVGAPLGVEEGEELGPMVGDEDGARVGRDEGKEVGICQDGPDHTTST